MSLDYVAWLVIALACGIIEMLTLGFWFLFLALAALAMSGAVALGLVPGLTAQVLLFGALTVALIVFARPLAMRLFKTRNVPSNVDSMVGMTAVVTRDIAPLDTGLVKIYGEVWTAYSDHYIPAGARVVIRRVDGVKVWVDPLEHGPEKPGQDE
jgi:membrane protein implicated in regulation of membrane protease activity